MVLEKSRNVHFRNLKIEIQGLLLNIEKLEEKMAMNNKLCSLFLAER